MSDELDLAEADRRARERLRLVRREASPMPLADVARASTGIIVARPVTRVQCPACGFPCLPWELATEPRCERCRDIESNKLALIAERLERIPPEYRVGSLEKPPEFLPAEAIRTAAMWLHGSARRLSILGPSSGSGKSSLAGCITDSAIVHGISAQWVHASDLVPDHEHPETAKRAAEMTRTAPLVIIDGCGKEFGGERADSFDVGLHKRWMMRLFTRIHEAKDQRFVLTVDLDGPGIAAYYDLSVARRIAPDDPQTVITLERKGPLRLAAIPKRT